MQWATSPAKFEVEEGAIMSKTKFLTVLLCATVLSGCGKTAVECSSGDAKAALEVAIREGLEKAAIDKVKDDTGDQPISSSSIRAAVASIKLIIENIRTTKEDPNSTKRFCTGNLKIVFSAETLDSASKARELVNLSNVEKMAEDNDVEKGVDYLKSDLDYSVQPTDDGEKVFAEFEGSTSKLDVFGEVIVASLLKSHIEAQVKQGQEQADAERREQEAALMAERNANLEQANLAARSADQAINVIWQSLDADTRKGLLAQQRIWLKQRDASCKVQAIQASADVSDRNVSELQCRARMTNERMNELQGYLGETYGD